MGMVSPGKRERETRKVSMSERGRRGREKERDEPRTGAPSMIYRVEKKRQRLVSESGRARECARRTNLELGDGLALVVLIRWCSRRFPPDDGQLHMLDLDAN